MSDDLPPPDTRRWVALPPMGDAVHSRGRKLLELTYSQEMPGAGDHLAVAFWAAKVLAGPGD